MSKLNSSIAVLKAPGSVVFESETLDAGDLRAGELLCETLVSAISPGTELAAYAGAPPLRPQVTYPRYVGYCNVARVVACGAGVPADSVGDRILSFTSHRSHFKISTAEVLAKVPANVSSEDASCAYLFHLGYNAVLGGDVRLGSSVAVIGLGVVGLCAVSMAILAGARVAAVSDRDSARQRATKLGAACFDRSGVPAAAAALGGGAHAVIITTNSWADWRSALELATVRGAVVVLGFPGRTDPKPVFNPLDSAYFYTRQLRIIAAGMSPEKPDGRGFLPFNERDNLARILDWIGAGAIAPMTIVSGEFSGFELADAYERLAHRDESSLTYLLRWAR